MNLHLVPGKDTYLYPPIPNLSLFDNILLNRKEETLTDRYKKDGDEKKKASVGVVAVEYASLIFWKYTLKLERFKTVAHNLYKTLRTVLM